MSILQNIDKQKAINLLVGSIGIYFSFVVSNVLFEWMTKLPYKNINTGE